MLKSINLLIQVFTKLWCISMKCRNILPIKQMAELVLCHMFTKTHIITIIPPYPITENDIVNKVYVYEKEGFCGDFTIEIKADGTFTYYEGMLSSHIGSGEWTYTDTDRMLTLFEKMVRLDENGNWEQFTQSYSFLVEEDTLIFVNKGSDNGLGNFLYVKVKDGEKFFAR